MEEDSVKLQNERRERIRNLLEQQGREIENFDAESLRMGFSTVVITNYGDQVFVDPQVQGGSGAKGPRGPPGAIHPSASTSAIVTGNSVAHQSGNLPRSSSGSNIRSGNVAPAQQHSPVGVPYSHRTGRAGSDAPTRGVTNSAQGHPSYLRSGSANLNRNNSARIVQGSPGLQRKVLDPEESGRRSAGRNSPAFSGSEGNRHPRNIVQLDENSSSMLQRAVENRNRPNSRGPSYQTNASGVSNMYIFSYKFIIHRSGCSS